MEPGKVSSGRYEAPQPPRQADQRLKEVVQEFEAILISSLLKEVRPTTQAGSIAYGMSHDLYQQLFTEEVARAIARSGGIGVGRVLERQLQGMLQAGGVENRLKTSAPPADLTVGGDMGSPRVKEYAGENREPR